MEHETQQLEVIQPHALELIQRAEIDMQIATAKKYPRDLAKVKRRMLDFATLDEETAESCFYTLTRDGKVIQGPSVRLAEIAVACYTNIRAASRVIDNNGKVITCQGVCHDLENNTLISVEVQRRITDRKGRTYSEDMQVTTGNAGNAIAFRNAVFKVVPGALIKPVYEAAKKVAVGDASTLTTKRAKVISRLNAMQVDTPRILAKVGKSSVENIGLEDLEILIGLGTAIKDGDTTVDEAFPIAKPAEAASVNVDQFKPSNDPNRGHDATMPQGGDGETGKLEKAPRHLEGTYTPETLPDAMELELGTTCIYQDGGKLKRLTVTQEEGEAPKWTMVEEVSSAPEQAEEPKQQSAPAAAASVRAPRRNATFNFGGGK